MTSTNAHTIAGREATVGDVLDAPVRLVAIETLRPSSDNPRRISPARLEQLKRSLAADPQMLQARPVIALPDGTIVAGNMRYHAAVALDWTEIACVTVDLDSERARLWMLRDNQTYGEWDEASLTDLLRELATLDVDLDLTGFDERELARLLDELEHDVNPLLASMTYSLLIDCASESEQVALATRLESEGLTVKLLMA